MQSGHCIDAVFVAEFQNFILRLLLSIHRFRVLKSKISKFYRRIHGLQILCRDFRFYRGEKGLSLRLIARSHSSRAPPPQHRIALLAPKPHLTSDDASGADCVRAFLFSGLRRMKFCIDKFLKFHYR